MLILFLITLSSTSKVCDISVEGGICLYKGESVLLPNARQSGLTGYWTFDDNKALDYSGNKNHAKSSVPAGHSAGGRGSSAKFSGSEYLEIPSADSLSAKIFSATFWTFLEKDDAVKITEEWCPLLQKGNDDATNVIYERTPAVFFNRNTRGIRVYITTTEAGDFPEGEFVDSYARIQYHRWNHIAVIRTQSKIKLYINGIPDNTNSTEGWTSPNKSPLYIGSTPAKLEACQMPLLIDEVRYFDRELTEIEIQSEAAGALGQIEPRYIKFGCYDCTVSSASSACSSSYHLCTTIELHSGGYSVARINGWTDLNRNVWSYSALEAASDSDELGLGICCLNLG